MSQQSYPELNLRRVDHIGIPVTDLDRSIAFYSALTGVEPTFVNPMYGEGLSRGAELSDARVRFAMIEIGNLALELLQYESPDPGGPFDQPNNRTGSVHIAFEVDDIDAAYERCKAAGIHVNAPPHEFTEEDGAPDVIGVRFLYIRDPDGIQLELNQSN